MISRSGNGGRSFTGGSRDVRTLPAARDGDNQDNAPYANDENVFTDAVAIPLR